MKRWIFPALGLGLICWMTGCRSPGPRPTVDVAQPGWSLTEAQVLWTPRPHQPAWVGELLVASNPDGRRLVQFSKSGLPAMTAQVSRDGWWLDAPMFSLSHRGVGSPPRRLLWFYLTHLPPTLPLPPDWELQQGLSPEDPKAWLLRNRRTGETLQGFAP